MKIITYRTFEAYMGLCRYYGCKPTVNGFMAFANGARKRLAQR